MAAPLLEVSYNSRWGNMLEVAGRRYLIVIEGSLQDSIEGGCRSSYGFQEVFMKTKKEKVERGSLRSSGFTGASSELPVVVAGKS